MLGFAHSVNGVSGFVCILSHCGTKLWFASVKPSAGMLIRIAFDLSNPDTIKNPATTNVVTGFLVGVSGFEPQASWTRTKRDTKLRHTPSAMIL